MIEFSVRRPVSILMLNLGLIVLGVISAARIPMRLLPPIVTPEFSIITRYPGATPGEIEEKVTTPIEKALATESGLSKMESVTEDGRSMVQVRFTSDIEILQTISNIRDKLNELSFDKNVSRPKIVRFNPNAAPIMQVSISSKKSSNDKQIGEMAEFIRNDLVKKLEAIDGVAMALLIGGPKKEIIIEVDPIRANQFNIDITSLLQVIRSKNKNLSGGSIYENGRRVNIIIGQKLSSLEDLENLVVKQKGSKEIRLRDLAKIIMVTQKPNIRTHLMGKDGLTLQLKKESEANTVQVALKARKIISTFLNKNPEIRGEVLVNQGKEIKSSIDNVIDAVINGGFLAILVIFIFLQSMKSTVIVGLSIPISLMITLVLMYFTGVSFNLMSLGGLALGVGMLVDNSIVVLENINRVKGEQDDLKQAVIWGTQKVSGAIVASTLTTVAVFGPLVFVSGMIGQLFRDISLTVVYSLTSSLFVALVLIPCLSALDFYNHDDKKKKKGKEKDSFPLKLLTKAFDQIQHEKSRRSLFLTPYYFSLEILKALHIFAIIATMHLLSLLSRVKKHLSFLAHYLNLGVSFILRYFTIGLEKIKFTYVTFLNNFLKKKSKPLLLVLALLVLSFVILALKGAELFSGDASNKFTYRLEFSSGLHLDLTEKQVRRIEKKILDIPGINTLTSIIGQGGSQWADIMVQTNDWPQMVEQKVVNILSNQPDLKYSKLSNNLISGSKPLEVVLIGNDLQKLEQQGKIVIEALKEIPGLKDIETSIKGEISKINIEFEQNKLDQYNVQHSQYTQRIRLLVMGQSVGNLSLDGQVIPMKVKGHDQYFNRLEKLKNFQVNNKEVPILLSQVSKVKRNNIVGAIKHIDRKRVVTVSCDTDDSIDLKSASENIKKLLAKKLTSPDIKWELAGQDAERKESERSLIFAILLSLFLIYILLASQFENFMQPFIILCAVPLCLVGVSFLLGLLQMDISALVFIGLIILVGISVNTSIVLVDTMNISIISGMDRFAAIVESAKNRLRPILMTAASTVIGLLPMAIGLGQGAAMRRPLAITVIGGLISSTILTLIVVPLIYDLISRKKKI